MSKPDDKSAVKEYCKSEDEHDLAAFDDHTNLSVPALELQSKTADHRQTSTHMKSFIPRIPPRILGFCGGGTLCLAHIGILKSLSKHSLLSSVRECVGISAGTIISLLYVLGYTLDEIERLSLSLDFTSFFPQFDPNMLLTLYTTWGLDTGAVAERFIRSLFTTKGISPDITFAELAKQGMKLRCYATEIQTANIKEFSASKTPTVSIAFAIRASISLPVIFTPVRDVKAMYMDGGIIHNTPLPFLTEAEIRDTLCFHFDMSHTNVADMSLMDACKCIYTSMTKLRNDAIVQKYKENTICVPMHGELPIQDSYSLPYRNRLIQKGEDACNSFLKKGVVRPRRFSAV
jgi:predicted acylesterase/phospholipase RssA